MKNINKNINTKTKKQHRYKGFKKGSINQRVFYIAAYLINEASKETVQSIKNLCDLFYEYSMDSLAQKFHGTYYANLKNSMPTGKEMKQATIKKAIKKLELLDYIKIKQDNQNKEKFKISITKKGAQEYLKYKIEKKKKTKWDGKWRIIIFDILESQRQIRNLLRRKLKWLGFKELQKSAWVFPYDVERETKEILEVCNIDIVGDVRFLTVERMNNDEDLKKEFGLN